MEGEQKSKNEQLSNALNYFDSFLTKKKFPPLRGTKTNDDRSQFTSEMVTADLLSSWVMDMCSNNHELSLSSIDKYVSAIKLKLITLFPSTLPNVFLKDGYYTQLRKAFIKACTNKARGKGKKVVNSAPMRLGFKRSFVSC